MNFDHIFFDLDNTLLNDSKTKSYYLPRIYQDFSSHIDRDFQDFSKAWTEAIPRYHKLYLEGKLTFDGQRRARIVDSFGKPDLDAQLVSAADSAFLRYFEESWQPFDGLLEYLGSSSVRKSVITNGNGSQQRKKLEKLGIAEFFEHVHISEELGVAKPSAAIFELAAMKVKARTSSCLMVGDSFEHDIIGASGVGMATLWFCHSETRDSPLPKDCTVVHNAEAMFEKLREFERTGI